MRACRWQVCTRLFRDLGSSCPPLKRLTRGQVEEFREKGYAPPQTACMASVQLLRHNVLAALGGCMPRRYIVVDSFVGRDVAARVRSEVLLLHRQGVGCLLKSIKLITCTAQPRSQEGVPFCAGRFQEASRSGLGSGRDFTGGAPMPAFASPPPPWHSMHLTAMLPPADRTARGDHVLWLHPGRSPATAPSLAASLAALQV